MQRMSAVRAQARALSRPIAGISPRRAALAVLAFGAAVALGLWALWPELSAWALATQAEMQAALARGVRAAQSGAPGASWAVVGACAVYGLAHAIGPGHGKALIAGAALASRRTALRMAGLGLTASLAQGLVAIVLVYGGLGVLALSTAAVTDASERWLVPIGFFAVAAIGAWVLLRGLAGLRRTVGRPRAHGPGGAHDHVCHAGCSHGPSAAQVDAMDGWRGAAALIAGVAVRPCAGALLVLAIAWRLDLLWLGAAAVVAMALGTGAVVALVGLFAGRMRDAGYAAGADRAPTLVFMVHALVGALLLVVGLALGLDAARAADAPRPGGVFGAPGSVQSVDG